MNGIIEINCKTGEVKNLLADKDAELSTKQTADLEKLMNYAIYRAAAFSSEADPLFFQEQRGEIPVGSWQAKVDEIKLRYPKP